MACGRRNTVSVITIYGQIKMILLDSNEVILRQSIHEGVLSGCLFNPIFADGGEDTRH